jgi:predicted metal-dependent hydrolase
MYTIDDPMFSLILRFVGKNKEVTFCNHAFIQKQLKSIQKHIEKFPPEEQESRAIEWISKHAREYRKNWEITVMDNELSNQRCPDCPLSTDGTPGHCQIHEKWLELLHQYAADKINSKKYIEQTLKLLAQHKEDLKIKLSMMEKKAS